MKSVEQKNNKIEVSIIIPTNGKRPDVTSKSLASIASQSMLDNCELIIVSEGKSNINKFDIARIPHYTEIIVPEKNGIFLNFLKGAEIASGENLLLLDDDMVLQEADLIETLQRFLTDHSNVWAAGPFIDEFTGSSTDKANKRYDVFKRLFKLWDPDDYTNKVYSCYGKGSANHSDTLPALPYIGCMWLTNAALLIRKNVFIEHSCDDLHSFSKYWPIQKIWAVDFFTTYRLFLKKKDALAFIPTKSVLHLGAGKTGFDISDRIIRETLCGYYYYMRYMRSQSFVTYFILPSIGRLIYVLLTSKGMKHRVKNSFAYMKSFWLLYRWRHKVNTKTTYISDLRMVHQDDLVKVLHINYE